MPQPNPAIGELATTTTDNYSGAPKKKKPRRKPKSKALSDAITGAMSSTKFDV